MTPRTVPRLLSPIAVEDLQAQKLAFGRHAGNAVKGGVTSASAGLAVVIAIARSGNDPLPSVSAVFFLDTELTGDDSGNVRAVAFHVFERSVAAREITMLQRRRQLEVLVLREMRMRPSMPESMTAHTIPDPPAANDLCAASAFTVLIDLLMSGFSAKSGQM